VWGTSQVQCGGGCGALSTTKYTVKTITITGVSQRSENPRIRALTTSLTADPPEPLIASP